MKIKVIILEHDRNYLERFVSAFGSLYSEKIELYSFSDPQMAFSAAGSIRADVFLQSDYFDMDTSQLPQKLAFAYFVDSVDIETVNSKPAICKFQKAELIYKAIISLYSEMSGKSISVRRADSDCRLFVFSSPCGGVGTSTMAAACAKNMAARGLRTLYLNLERFGSSEVFFSSEGQGNLGDLIFAVKSKKNNIPGRIESFERTDQSGVIYFRPTVNALDMMNLSADDIKAVVLSIIESGLYTCVVLDIDFDRYLSVPDVAERADAVVWVGDGSPLSNSKIIRCYQSLTIEEARRGSSLISSVNLIYNRFSSKTSRVISEVDIRNIGGAPKIEHANVDTIVSTIQTIEAFDQLLQ